jgi:hypothetical protein
MSSPVSGHRGTKTSSGWQTELAYALAQPELAQVEQDTEPARRTAYWLAVVLGHCRLEAVELDELDGSLPEPIALAACRHFVRIVPAWCEDARRLDKCLLPGQDQMEENEQCFELLEARMQAWAVYVAIDEAYQVSVEDRSPRPVLFGQSLDEVLDRVQEFDLELQTRIDLLARIARYHFLENCRRALAPEYSDPLPWWLDGRLEEEAERIARDPETWLPRKRDFASAFDKLTGNPFGLQDGAPG